MNIPDEAIEAALLPVTKSFRFDVQDLDSEEMGEWRDFLRGVLEAAAPILLRNTRRMSLAEIEERDNPELMKAARERVRAGAKAYRAEQIRAAKAEALRDAADYLDTNTGPNAIGIKKAAATIRQIAVTEFDS